MFLTLSKKIKRFESVSNLVHHFDLRRFFHVIANSLLRIAGHCRAPFSSRSKLKIWKLLLSTSQHVINKRLLSKFLVGNIFVSFKKKYNNNKTSQSSFSERLHFVGFLLFSLNINDWNKKQDEQFNRMKEIKLFFKSHLMGTAFPASRILPLVSLNFSTLMKLPFSRFSNVSLPSKPTLKKKN